MLLQNRPESQFVVMWSPKTPIVSCTSVLTTFLSRSYYETHRQIKTWSEKLIGCGHDHMTTNPLTWPFVVIPSGPTDHKMTTTANTRTGQPTAGCVQVFEWRETGRMSPAFPALGRADL